jgi:hypothetical protein
VCERERARVIKCPSSPGDLAADADTAVSEVM